MTDPSIHVNIISWFAPRTVDEKRSDKKTDRVSYCRVCGKEIVRHKVIEEWTATADEITEARAAGAQDGETFFAHLYTAHRNLFGADDPTDIVPN